MPTLSDLAKMHSITAEYAVEILEKQGFEGLSANTEITEFAKLLVFDRAIFSHLKSQRPAPSPAAGGEAQAHEVPQPTVTSTRESPEEQQRMILSRDFVVFTYMSLRKPATSGILCEVLRLRYTRSTSTKIVVTSIAQDMVHESASSDTSMVEMAQNLLELEENGFLTVLPCRKISEEFTVISDFLASRRLSDSIVIIGVNRPLSSFVENRNKYYMANPPENERYTLIYQRDVTAKGRLTNPQKTYSVFINPESVKVAPYDESTPLLDAADIPGLGSMVYADSYSSETGTHIKVPIFLDSLMNDRGGEAVIYKLQGGKKCVKIFKSRALTEMKIKKVELMCKMYSRLRSADAPLMDRIAWPEHIVYNENGVPVGYVMKLFDSTRPLIDYTVYEFERLVPGLTKTHQVTMAVSLCEIVEFCHFNNIILCDINKCNVLYDKDMTAHLCDIDSAQLADEQYCYPSNVGMPEFLPPERIGCRDFSFIRKKSDDTWILQILLFHILTPCGSPYAFVEHGKVEDIHTDPIRLGLYPFGSATVEPDAFIKERHADFDIVISHLHYKMRNAFWHCFSSSGSSFEEYSRKSAYFWLDKAVEYRRSLPEMIERDRNSNEYRPKEYRCYDDTEGMYKLAKSSGEQVKKRNPQVKNDAQTPDDNSGKKPTIRRISWDD